MNKGAEQRTNTVPLLTLCIKSVVQLRMTVGSGAAAVLLLLVAILMCACAVATHNCRAPADKLRAVNVSSALQTV